MSIINQFINSINDAIKRNLIMKHLNYIRNSYRNNPVPLEKILELKTIYGGIIRSQDILLPPLNILKSKGSSLQIDELKSLLYNDTLGEWSLDKNTIEFIWHKLVEEKPNIIIECGAGISTIILSKYASIYSSSINNIIIISLEQDLNVKKDLENRLEQLGLLGHVFILHTPVSDKCEYIINEFDISDKIRSGAEWLLIDGPSGPDGCRYWTLPLLLKFCKNGTKLLLDDALRDGELDILLKWSKLPGITVEGIYPLGKGLANCIINIPE